MEGASLITVYGTGPDSKGLVGKLAGAIAVLGGNVVDLEQNVARGQFSFFSIAEFPAGADAGLPAALGAIAKETGLTLHSAPAKPSTSPAEGKKLFLLILIGPDKPGIIAAIAQGLGKHGVNIEGIRNVAREGVFLMELLADMSGSNLPEPNLRRTIGALTAEGGIRAMFQFEDVFNKKKRAILLDRGDCLIAPGTLEEIAEQTGLDRGLLAPDADAIAGASAARLEGCPAELLEGIAASFSPSAGTMELVRELKSMGYRVALAARAFAPFAERLGKAAGADYAWGLPLEIDADSRTVAAPASAGETAAEAKARFCAGILRREGILNEDLVAVEDAGLSFAFDPRFLLDAVNRRALSAEALAGVLSGLGALRGGL